MKLLFYALLICDEHSVTNYNNAPDIGCQKIVQLEIEELYKTLLHKLSERFAYNITDTQIHKYQLILFNK